MPNNFNDTILASSILSDKPDAYINYMKFRQEEESKQKALTALGDVETSLNGNERQGDFDARARTLADFNATLNNAPLPSAEHFQQPDTTLPFAARASTVERMYAPSGVLQTLSRDAADAKVGGLQQYYDEPAVKDFLEKYHSARTDDSTQIAMNKARDVVSPHGEDPYATAHAEMGAAAGDSLVDASKGMGDYLSKNFEARTLDSRQDKKFGYDTTLENQRFGHDVSLENLRSDHNAALKQFERDNPGVQKPAATQFAAANFALRMEKSDEVVRDLEAKGFQPSKYINMFGNYDWSNIAKNPTAQKYFQAKRTYVNSILRRESGAVIADSEFKQADLQYFPTIGDDSGTVAQKEDTRLQTLSGLKTEAGPAYESVVKTYQTAKDDRANTAPKQTPKPSGAGTPPPNVTGTAPVVWLTPGTATPAPTGTPQGSTSSTVDRLRVLARAGNPTAAAALKSKGLTW